MIMMIFLKSIFVVWRFPALGIRSIFITQHISGKLGLLKPSGEFLTNAQGGRDELEPR